MAVSLVETPSAPLAEILLRLGRGILTTFDGG